MVRELVEIGGGGDLGARRGCHARNMAGTRGGARRSVPETISGGARVRGVYRLNRIEEPMRHTQLVAAGAAMLAMTAPAAAQDRPAPAPRAEIASPEGRTFLLDRDETPRAALGVNTSSTGTRRDTLGLLITSIVRGGPAEKAGLEEGNRIAAINGVSLRANAVDIDDYESAGTLSRRLVRELEKVKPGNEVELRVYREGRAENLRVRTVSSDSLFKRASTFRRVSREEMDDRPALGIGLGSTGSRRDTLGVLVMSVQDSSPAARAGLEEGNRIAAVNGVNLRVAHEDADDPSLGRTKAQRLMREVSQLKPGDNVTLRLYANGQFRDVTMKVARAGDLPRSRGMTYFGGPDFPVMPAMPAMPAMPPGARGVFRTMENFGPIRFELSPGMGESLESMRTQLDKLRPELERIRTKAPVWFGSLVV
ncbi:MAG: hypothetical protein DMD35_10755 [Gemmatimonadetes bacterium]|nr:MAG: hypothetical protein DMD35_10755 [Gemmatimonadota bacterium]